MKKTRVILAAIAAGAGSLLAVTHLGNNKLAPGAELGIEIAATPDGNGAIISHDSAEMDAFVELRMTPAGGAGFTAALDNGTPLGTSWQPSPDGWFVRIFKAGGASTSDRFTWPNGVRIRLARLVPAAPTAAPGAALVVRDWQVYPKDDESDAAWKARRRSNWRWFALIVAVVSAAAAVLSTLAEEKAPAKKAHSARDSVEALIDETAGKDPEETAALRAYLRKRYIESATLQEALDATGLSPAKARLVSVKARNIFPKRVETLIAELQDIYAELITPDPPPPPSAPPAPPPQNG